MKLIDKMLWYIVYVMWLLVVSVSCEGMEVYFNLL